MTKKLLILLVGAALLVALPGLSMANSWPFSAHLVGFADGSGPGTTFQRYFLPGVDRGGDNAFGPGLCGDGLAPAPGESCVATWKNPADGFRGATDNIFNYADAPFGSVLHAVWDHEQGTGTANHTGYFSWSCGAVNDGAKHQWQNVDCVGTLHDGACLGNGSPDTARDVASTPQGTLAAIGGLGVMPVPTVSGVVGTTVSLSWDAVAASGCATEATYELSYFIDDLTDGACNLPTEADFTVLGTAIPGTTRDVDVSVDLGGDSFGADQAKGIVFALRLNYGNTASGEIASRYLSANGQCVSFDQALAAELYDLQVRHAGRNNVEVSWKSSLEDGVRGFYVTRATTIDGAYTRVSDLIVANGEPSAYSFIDSITAPRGRVRATGLFYKIESLDIDDNTQVFGPAALELPTQAPGRVPQARPMRRR